MEAATRSTRDRHEQERKHERVRLWLEPSIGRILNLRHLSHEATDNNAEECEQHRQRQEVTSKKSARLKQGPHWHYRRDEAVQQQQYVPGFCGAIRDPRRHREWQFWSRPNRY